LEICIGKSLNIWIWFPFLV